MKIFIEDLKREFFETGTLSEKSCEDLENYLENNQNDIDFYEGIYLVTNAKIYDLIPKVISLINHEKEKVRIDIIIGLISKLNLPEYTELALKMYREDKALEVKVMILYNLGYIIKNLKDRVLRKEIAEEIIKGLDRNDEGYSYRNAAYHSIVNALDVDIKGQPDFAKDLQVSDLNYKIIDEFKKIYILKENFQKKEEASKINLALKDERNLIETLRLYKFDTLNIINFINSTEPKNNLTEMKIDSLKICYKSYNKDLKGARNVINNIIKNYS